MSRRRNFQAPHNPLLAEPLFLAGYIEQAGAGTLDMTALSRAVAFAPLPRPDPMPEKKHVFVSSVQKELELGEARNRRQNRSRPIGEL